MNSGIDLGYSGVKAVAGERRVEFPSIVGTPDKGRFSLNGSGTGSIVLTAPAHVMVGDGAITQSRFIQRREDRNWIESDEYYYLFLAAMSELVQTTTTRINLVTGLPVSFYGDRQRLQDRLSGAHHVCREGRAAQAITVGECRIIPQPFGALLASALDCQGRVQDSTLATGTVGVIDVGGKTTNLLSVRRLAEIGRETTSVPVGAWDVVRAVKDYLADHCPQLEPRDHQVIEAIQARQIRYYGESVDLGAVVDEALAPMAEQVVSQATQLWNGGANLDAILIAGGGAHLLGSRIRARFRHATVVADPVFANATGYWKLAQRSAAG